VKTIVLLPEQPPPFKRNIRYQKPFYKTGDKYTDNIFGSPVRQTFNEETASAGEATGVETSPPASRLSQL
jgi:hypothetical protein